MTPYNYKKVNLKRKSFSKGGKQNFKRFKKTPKYVKENVENKVAREKERDAFDFTDSENEADDLGMGLEISDLLNLDDNHSENQSSLIALTQDTVRPLFSSDADYEESKLEEALVELRHSSFRPNQKETIKRILFGRSTLFISPTGSGKSLCYLLPALLYWRYRKYMTIVVSPLISLMEDQMSNFPASIKAVSLHSGHSRAQRTKSIAQLANLEAQVAFISPEAIVGGVLSLDDLKNLPPVGFVCIDEAHCLSEWSHNFRPAYLQFFKILHEQMKIKTYLGLTATATKATSFAISKNLIINPETDVIGSTTVPDNLILSVSCEKNKKKALIDLLKTPTFRIMTSIIVYCNRREETELVASIIRTAMQKYSTLIEVPERKSTAASKDDSIKSTGSDVSTSSVEKPYLELSWHAEAYHAGLSMETRKRIQRQFIKGETRVVVATIAFGMGINKANVRAIIHYSMPSSFESYVQEIGRAGRDGKPAQCHMFLTMDKTDLYYQLRNIYSSVPERKNLTKLTEYLFKPCRCLDITNERDFAQLDRRNQLDPHEISSWKKSTFTDTEASEELDDDLEYVCYNDENFFGEKENRPTRYVRKSVVKKHRACNGHEVAFGLDEAVEAINLKPESIITLICQIQQAYPQLKITQYNPTKSTCNLFCYHGPDQMSKLKDSSRAVCTALLHLKLKHMKETGTEYTIPDKISFDVIEVATRMGKPSVDVMRMLKKTEWELVEKTGKFRRSQVRVSFEGNSFHLWTVGDLNDEEISEINDFLLDFNRLYETVERAKMERVFDTFKRHCIDIEQMTDKQVRLEASARLKVSLNTYFNPLLKQQISSTSNEGDTLTGQSEEADNSDNDSAVKLSVAKEQAIRKDARAFISGHGNKFRPHTIAKIFQGISTPNYTAEHWGQNKKWWRIHLDVDFVKLSEIINRELVEWK